MYMCQRLEKLWQGEVERTAVVESHIRERDLELERLEECVGCLKSLLAESEEDNLQLRSSLRETDAALTVARRRSEDDHGEDDHRGTDCRVRISTESLSMHQKHPGHTSHAHGRVINVHTRTHTHTPTQHDDEERFGLQRKLKTNSNTNDILREGNHFYNGTHAHTHKHSSDSFSLPLARNTHTHTHTPTRENASKHTQKHTYTQATDKQQGNPKGMAN
eukprot:GHVR01123397.1.p1 GENE.GHVR01123397.1~~GHVR01123397.1.p1  ORF type:complete len:219 (+),score=73.52 GHVR01123397.1:101-757(+)